MMMKIAMIRMIVCNCNIPNFKTLKDSSVIILHVIISLTNFKVWPADAWKAAPVKKGSLVLIHGQVSNEEETDLPMMMMMVVMMMVMSSNSSMCVKMMTIGHNRVAIIMIMFRWLTSLNETCHLPLAMPTLSMLSVRMIKNDDDDD